MGLKTNKIWLLLSEMITHVHAITSDLRYSVVIRYHFMGLEPVASAHPHTSTSPLTLFSPLQLTRMCAHPLPQRCTGTVLKLSKQPASHTPCVQQALASNTLARNTHPENNGVHASPRALTQVGQSCSGSSKQSSSVVKLITILKIRFHLRPRYIQTIACHMCSKYALHAIMLSGKKKKVEVGIEK